MATPVYAGPFGVEQAQRLLWRAGFGPRHGEAEKLAALGLDGAVDALLHPPAFAAVGPEPSDRGLPLAPDDAYGHDHLWWLDRMVRGNQPLVERMTLIWHDWFATSNQKVGSQKLMLQQNQTMRIGALGSFRNLFLAMTEDPAMLVWLDGIRNTKRAPNENYAREMMELFSLGASNGYTEADVREQARSLTGWTASYQQGLGLTGFAFNPLQHDTGVKTVFGQAGNFDFLDSVRLCVTHPDHPAFFVTKLWSYFVPVPPDAATLNALVRIYVQDHQIQPVVRAILRHPQLYTGPRLVKPPVVYQAGLMRALQSPVDGTTWMQLAAQSGQRLFYPPDVSGWDDTRWLDTSTFRARWFIAAKALTPYRLDERVTAPRKKATDLLAAALHLFAEPSLLPTTQHALVAFADSAQQVANPHVVENALRQLIAVSPELQAA
ncbi:MAG: DUF1800 domain-containing protein [Actinobacteria bacterium]|nr:DUF1800 domain-containing protein [Actinomycetota bacterium]